MDDGVIIQDLTIANEQLQLLEATTRALLLSLTTDCSLAMVTS